MIAHELTHTMQQGASKTNPLTTDCKTSVSTKNNIHRSIIDKVPSLSNTTDKENTFQKEDAVQAAENSDKQMAVQPKIEVSHLKVDARGNLHQTPTILLTE